MSIYTYIQRPTGYSPTSSWAKLCRLLASWCASSVVEKKDYILLSFFQLVWAKFSLSHSQKEECSHSQALHKVVNSPISIDYEISTAIPVFSTNKSEFLKLSSFSVRFGDTIPVVAMETPITIPIIDWLSVSVKYVGLGWCGKEVTSESVYYPNSCWQTKYLCMKGF